MIQHPFKCDAKDIQNKTCNSFRSHLGPSCTNSPLSPQKLDVEGHCVGPESRKIGFLSAQNDRWKIMHFENHALCVDKTVEK